MIMENQNTIEKRKNFRYAAVACFIVEFLIKYHSSMGYLLPLNKHAISLYLCFGGYILIVLALFTNRPKMAVGGCILEVFFYYPYFDIFGYLRNINGSSTLVSPYLIMYIVNTTTWIILIVACIKTTNSKKFSIIASNFHLIGQIALFTYIYNYFWSFSSALDFTLGFYGFKSVISFMLSIIAFISASVLLGIGFDTSPNPIPSLVGHANNPANAAVPSQVERLTKLKELLDNGVITQEEFDEKKRQILGLPHDTHDRGEQ